MSFTVHNYHHEEWDRQGLADYGDFSDMTTDCNVRDHGDYSSGEWFYIPDEKLPAMEGVDYEGKVPNERAIYFGSFGNDNAPGASHYTDAEIFDMDDPEDIEEFYKRKAEWESAPESLDEYETCPDCNETFNVEAMEQDDEGNLVCPECAEKREESDE